MKLNGVNATCQAVEPIKVDLSDRLSKLIHGLGEIENRLGETIAQVDSGASFSSSAINLNCSCHLEAINMLEALVYGIDYHMNQLKNMLD